MNSIWELLIIRSWKVSYFKCTHLIYIRARIGLKQKKNILLCGVPFTFCSFNEGNLINGYVLKNYQKNTLFSPRIQKKRYFPGDNTNILHSISNDKLASQAVKLICIIILTDGV